MASAFHLTFEISRYPFQLTLTETTCEISMGIVLSPLPDFGASDPFRDPNSDSANSEARAGKK